MRNALTSMLAINAAAVVMARSNLQTVDEPEDHVIETDLTGGGGDNAPTVEENDAAATFEPVAVTVDELPDDLPDARDPAEGIKWGFTDMDKNTYIFVPKALAQRARGAVQNARKTKGKDNGKKFQTFNVLSVESAKKRHPNAVDGDIEVWRIA